MIWALTLSATDLSTRCLTPAVCLNGILSLIEFGNLVGPLALSALYLRQIIRKAIPSIYSGEPAITGFDWPFTLSTSHSGTFSAVGFGPPQGFTLASTCSWIDHPVRGLIRTTLALFRLAFATASLTLNLAVQINSLTHYANRTHDHYHVSMAALAACKHQVSDSFTPLHRGSFHLSLTVLVHYRSSVST